MLGNEELPENCFCRNCHPQHSCACIYHCKEFENCNGKYCRYGTLEEEALKIRIEKEGDNGIQRRESRWPR